MLSPRQIHLDFHTTEKIPHIGRDFDPAAFAKTAKDAYISSMTIFARCHHGWLYYPSEKFPELVHPQLENKNLLLEQVRALHKEGINAPVYITVQWDYYHATRRPEWLVRKADGSHEGGSFAVPGFYQSLCVNTGYYEFLAAQTAEVCEMLGDELDGLFFDIVGIRPCLCASCRAEMQEKGIDIGDENAVRDFGKMVIDRFKSDMTALVRSYNKNCTIFYNAGHVGPCTKDSADSYSHFELESLPGDSWGYLHFPVTARYARTLGKDCMGMTGKFHTGWGDFHSLKNLAALEFECLRMLSFGFASSIGDQLEPTGTLNPATYRLIGKVYKQFAEREEWARPSVPTVEAAIVTGEDPRFEHEIPADIFGASQMLEELCIQHDVIDPQGDFDAYKLLILPDTLTACGEFQQKLDAYVQKGGKILACNRGGLSCDGNFPASFGLKYWGENQLFPDFIIGDENLGRGLEQDNEYVIYMPGATVEAEGAEPVMWARAPYFARKGQDFISHRYTPSAKGENYPAAYQNGNVLYFSHPLFSQYRDCAPRWCKTIIGNAIDVLLGNRLLRHNGPSTLTASLLEQPEQNRYTLHLLSYVPVRKSATIDIVEDRTVVNNVQVELNLPKAVKSARLVPEDVALTIEGGKLTVPEVNGYAIVELNY